VETISEAMPTAPALLTTKSKNLNGHAIHFYTLKEHYEQTEEPAIKCLKVKQ
jgi:hypothetical protein